jgi:hypothetical protein
MLLISFGLAEAQKSPKVSRIGYVFGTARLRTKGLTLKRYAKVYGSWAILKVKTLSSNIEALRVSPTASQVLQKN